MSDDKWRFKKEISLTGILAITSALLTAIWWGLGLEKKIYANSQSIEHFRQIQLRDREESRRYDSENRQALEKINQKLDQLIEYKKQ